jgi:hypothetical protein
VGRGANKTLTDLTPIKEKHYVLNMVEHDYDKPDPKKILIKHKKHTAVEEKWCVRSTVRCHLFGLQIVSSQPFGSVFEPLLYRGFSNTV